MEGMILVPYTKHEFKELIKKSLSELLTENSTGRKVEDFFMNAKEACVFLNIALPTLYAHTSKNTIPFMKKGKKLYFKKSELEAWLNEGKKKTVSEIEMDISW